MKCVKSNLDQLVIWKHTGVYTQAKPYTIIKCVLKDLSEVVLWKFTQEYILVKLLWTEMCFKQFIQSSILINTNMRKQKKTYMDGIINIKIVEYGWKLSILGAAKRVYNFENSLEWKSIDIENQLCASWGNLLTNFDWLFFFNLDRYYLLGAL